MEALSLPSSISHWRRQFDDFFRFLNDYIPLVSFGLNKINFIIFNINKFKANFLKNHQVSVSRQEIRTIYEFFKTCTAFKSILSECSPNKMLEYVIFHSANKQFMELFELWNSWAKQSSTLNIDAFSDPNPFFYANYLDLKALRETIESVIKSAPQNVQHGLSKRLQEIGKILDLPKVNIETNDDRIVDRSQFEIIDFCKETDLWKIYHAKLLPQNIEVTLREVKHCQLPHYITLGLKKSLSIAQKFNHPNILKFIAVSYKESLFTATNYIPYESLYSLLHINNANKLTPTLKLKIALGIIRGLEYIDEMYFSHGNLKSHNVFLDQNYVPLISDFFASKAYGKPMEEINLISKVEWTAPEVIKNTTLLANPSIDIYSYGIILWELLTNEIPYSRYKTMQIAIMVSERNLRPDIPPSTPEPMKKLITSCWNSNPRLRPRAADIRSSLESGSIIFNETDVNDFMAWVNETKEAHASILEKKKIELAAKESTLVQKILELTPSSINSIDLLEELQNIRFKASSNLFDKLYEIVTQSFSFSVQEKAFQTMKQMLNHDNIKELFDPEVIIDKMLKIIGNHPSYVIAIVKILAPAVNDINNIIEKILSSPNSYTTIELLKVVISSNQSKVSPQMIIQILSSIPEKYQTNFFDFALSMYGPLYDFFHPSWHSFPLLSLFLKKISLYCETNLESVKSMLDIEEFTKLQKGKLREILDSCSELIIKPNAPINEYSCYVILYFIIKNCLKFNETKTILKLLLICIRIGVMRKKISQSNIWDVIIKAIESDNEENINNALKLVDKIPICSDNSTFETLWKVLISKYQRSKQKNVTHTLCTIIKRKTDMNFSDLIPILLTGFSSDDPLYCITSLKITRHFDVGTFEKLNNESFWKCLTGHMQKKNGLICKLIGKLVTRMILALPNLKIDVSFFDSIISLLYDMPTPFDTAMQFIIFLSIACRTRDVLLALHKVSFVCYLQQLPWRYENDPRVAEAIDYYASSLSQYYSSSM